LTYDVARLLFSFSGQMMDIDAKRIAGPALVVPSLFPSRTSVFAVQDSPSDCLHTNVSLPYQCLLSTTPSLPFPSLCEAFRPRTRSRWGAEALLCQTTTLGSHRAVCVVVRQCGTRSAGSWLLRASSRPTDPWLFQLALLHTPAQHSAITNARELHAAANCRITVALEDVERLVAVLTLASPLHTSFSSSTPPTPAFPLRTPNVINRRKCESAAADRPFFSPTQP
jgi:hypothetical protein